MKAKKQSRLLVLSGNDDNTLWWFYNRERSVCPSYKLYQHPINRNALDWMLDEIHSDDVHRRIETVFLEWRNPNEEEIKIITRGGYERRVDWYMFFDLNIKYKAALPKEFYLYENGRFICQM